MTRQWTTHVSAQIERGVGQRIHRRKRQQAATAGDLRIEMTLKTFRYLTVLVLFCSAAAEQLEAAAKPLTPIRMTSTRGAYQIETIGDTLGQSSPQNTRLIIRVFGP